MTPLSSFWRCRAGRLWAHCVTVLVIGEWEFAAIHRQLSPLFTVRILNGPRVSLLDHIVRSDVAWIDMTMGCTI